VDEDRAGAAVGCDTIGWEGVVGDEVEYFAGARVEKAVARRRMLSKAVSEWHQEQGEELGGGTYFNWTDARFAWSWVGASVSLHYYRGNT